MDYGMFVLIAIVVLVIVAFIVYYWGFSSASETNHALALDGNEFYTSANAIPNTSDGVRYIYYANRDGIFSYDTEGGATARVSSMRAVGLAYDSGVLAIDAQGNLYNLALSATVPQESEVTALYSTMNGYAATVRGEVVSNGSTKAANGDYGLITYTVR